MIVRWAQELHAFGEFLRCLWEDIIDLVTLPEHVHKGMICTNHPLFGLSSAVKDRVFARVAESEESVEIPPKCACFAFVRFILTLTTPYHLALEEQVNNV